MPEILGEALELDLGSGTVVVVPTEQSPVASVNGKTGNVVLDAEDVGALPDDTAIPSKVSDLANDLHFVTADSAPGKLNYVDTVDPLGGSYYRSNAARDGNKLRLTYQDAARNTYFYIFLAKSLEAGKRYTLSFDCSGVQTGQSVFFRVCHAAGEVYDEGSPESDPFPLRDGRCSVTFTPQTGFQSMVRLDDAGETRPTGTDIVLENFQIEDGSTATAWHPSLDAAHNAAARIETLTRAMLEKEGWAVGLMDEEYLSASKTISKSLDSLTEVGGVNCSTTIYEVLPFPMKEANPVGTCDKLAGYIGSTDAASATHDGASVKLGISFRDYFPGLSAAPSPAQTVYNRVQIAGRVATPPESPGAAFTPDADIGAEIIAIAETYITALNNGRVFAYDRNFMNSENTSAVNNNDGDALMECDSFVGIVLRGVAYADSPYADTTPNHTQDYDLFMSNTASGVAAWATNLRTKIQDSNTARRYFGHDIKTAAEFAWMFWMIGGCLFTNPAKAAPGDVAFFRSPQTATWFDGITHIAIVGQPDANGMTIYEVTGYGGESAGKYLQHVSLRDRSSKPAYFARPYGWT